MKGDKKWKEKKMTNVEELIARLPKGYEEASGETGALKRRREIKSAYDLIKLILIYLTGGYSQLEMSVISGKYGDSKNKRRRVSEAIFQMQQVVGVDIAQAKPKGDSGIPKTKRA
jgi:hypothetical protein